MELVVAAIPRLLNLVLVLLQGSLIVVKDNLLLRTPVLVVRRLLTRRGLQLLSRVLVAATGGTETLLVELAILTVSFLLLRLHLQVLNLLLILVGLVHQLIIHLDALGWRISHTLDLAIVVLHLDFLQPLIRDLPEHVRVLLIVGYATDHLRGCLG